MSRTQLTTGIHRELFEPDYCKMNLVFEAFVQTDGSCIKTVKRSDIKDLILDVVYKNYVYFRYGGANWRATVRKHKWYNNMDGKEWFTYSITLPNESNRKSRFLIDMHPLSELESVFEYTNRFFEGASVCIRPIEVTRAHEVKFEASGGDIRVLLHIKFKQGYPQEDTNTWYSPSDVKKIMSHEHGRLRGCGSLW